MEMAVDLVDHSMLHQPRPHAQPVSTGQARLAVIDANRLPRGKCQPSNPVFKLTVKFLKSKLHDLIFVM